MRKAPRRVRPLSDFIASVDAGVSANCSERAVKPDDVLVLKTSAVLGGVFRATECKVVEPGERDRVRTQVLPDTIILCRKNSEENVGASVLVTKDWPRLYLPDLLWRIAPKSGVDAGWLSYVLTSAPVREAIRSRATGTHHSMKNIAQGALLTIEVLDQQQDEQRRIAEILRTWDEAIEKTERLIAAKRAALNHSSIALFSGRWRLGKRRTNWPSVSLTDVTTEAMARNGSHLKADAVMGVNKMHGMIPMKDHVRATNLSRYKVVRQGSFAYNPMRLNIGSIARNLRDRDVLVSPDYVAFEAKPDTLMPSYFDHLRRTWLWGRFVKTAGSGGVRVRIYYDDLADFILDLPPLDEQRRIVDLLDTGRREITLLEKQREALAKQKRGLMQKLLTGEWSVAEPKSKEAAE